MNKFMISWWRYSSKLIIIQSDESYKRVLLESRGGIPNLVWKEPGKTVIGIIMGL